MYYVLLPNFPPPLRIVLIPAFAAWASCLLCQKPHTLLSHTQFGSDKPPPTIVYLERGFTRPRRPQDEVDLQC